MQVALRKRFKSGMRPAATVINLNKIADNLGDLYAATGTDWVLRISHILTEPVCPTAIITPEGWHIARYRVDCETLEESLTKVVALVEREIIERKVVGSYAPYTNPDDDVFAKWLYARAAGSNDKLPDVPGRNLPEHFEWIADGYIAKNREHFVKALTEDSTDRFGRPRGPQSIRYLSAYISSRIGHMAGIERMDYQSARNMIERKLQEILP